MSVARPSRRALAVVVACVSFGSSAHAASWGLETVGGRRVVSSDDPEFQSIEVFPHGSIAEHAGRDLWLVPVQGGGARLVGRRAGVPVSIGIPVDGVVSQGAFSPDGSKAVLVVRPRGWTPDAAANAVTLRRFEAVQQTTLTVIAIAEDLSVRVVTPSLAPSASPDWNPLFLDEKTLLFQSVRTGLASFFVVDLETAFIRQLTNLSPFRGRLGHARAIPVAVTDGLVRVDATTVLFTTRTPQQEEVWRLVLRGPGYEASAGWLLPGALGTRGVDGRWTVVLGGRVVADVRGDGVYERRTR